MTSPSKCPACGQSLDVTGLKLHSPLQCPHCHHQFLLGATAGAVAAPVASSEGSSSAPAAWPVRAASSRTSRPSTRRETPVLLIGGLAGGAVLAIGVLLLAMNGNFEQPKPSPRNVATPKGNSATARVAPDKSASSSRGDTSALSGTPRSPRQRSASAPGAAKEVSPESARNDSDSASRVDGDSAAKPIGDSAMPSAPSEASTTDRALANAFISAERSPDSPSTKSNASGNPGDYPTNSSATPSSGEPSATSEPELSPEEKKRQDQIAKLKRLIARQFNVFRRSTDRRKGDPGDYFVVARYEMPLSTRMADVSFEISNNVDPSVTRVADYLLETPSGSLRDFQVVGRYESAEEADAGIARIREQYDRAKEYQQQLLAFLQQQQRFQATSIRRC